MKRVVTPELLDTNDGTAEEVDGSLADLRMVNRCFGGISTMQKMVRKAAQLTGLRRLSVLDVAGASGDIPAAVKTQLQREGTDLDVVLLDRATTHVGRAFPAVAADALALPFDDDSFDLVSCSLFVHHLEPDQVSAFFGEALRVCRHAVLINDLRRHPLHLALVYAGMPLYRSRITRHDAPASVWRSYTAREVAELAQQTTAATISVESSFLFRMGVTLWKDTGAK
jgi:ubiquinone/menaquinone biosynthesis C-methylase UbiE